MKRMVIVVVLILLCFGFCVHSFAQEPAESTPPSNPIAAIITGIEETFKSIGDAIAHSVFITQLTNFGSFLRGSASTSYPTTQQEEPILRETR